MKNTLNLSDLNIESELIPFFDISLNRHSRQTLAALFTDIPKTVEGALERQQVLAGFTANLDRIKPLPSYRADIEEVYEFCSRLHNQLPRSINNLRMFRWELRFSGRGANLFLSRSVQLLTVFEKVYQYYFSGLDVSRFPVQYRESIRDILAILTTFEKERASLIEKGHDLSIREVCGFLHRLYGVYKNGQLAKCWDAFFLFEAWLSIAVTAQKAGFVPARFIDKGIRLTNFFHPFIKAPVKNSIEIDRNVFVLTGPNMSGKSTLLRTVSLCIFLARLGMPVPAEECHVVFASEINVFINSRDNLVAGYSHFMTEIMNLKDSIISAQEGKPVFAVFDELFNGTNVDDALNILTVTINGLKKFPNSYFLLSTHFYKLKELNVEEMDHAAFYYIDSYLKNGAPVFTYQLKKGWSNVKFGTILFEREGLTQMLA